MRFCRGPFLLLALIVWGSALTARAEDGWTFRMERYSRDLHVNTLKGSGHVYLKNGDQEVWADEVEIDFNTKKAIANGNVHIREGKLETWCRHANYALSGEEATLDEATMTGGQFVVTGSVIRKIRKGVFEIDEGTYTNCNLDLFHDEEAGKCLFDWKIYGRHLSVTVEEYIHIQDAIVYVKRIPLIYLPYFIAPMKTQRQSGLLVPHFGYVADLGSSFEWPYFLTLGPWQDLTIDPTLYTKQGYHVGLNYRYIYSPTKAGSFNVYFTQWRFGDRLADNVRPDNVNRGRALGFVGEWSFSGQNVYSFGERSQIRADLRLVSDPYYTQYFSADLDGQAGLAALRSQVSLTTPSDDLLLTARVQRFQPLIISRDSGVDNGPVGELPTIGLSKVNAPFFTRLLSWEFDSRFSNFFRPIGYDDSVVALPLLTAPPASGPTAAGPLPPRAGVYLPGDYIRTGRRLQLEPRLIANVPMPNGLQFQPVLTAGTLAYHFDLPQSQFFHREYLQTELPFSLYLSRTFDTGLSGFEKVNHVFQPRIIFADALFQSEEPIHPFFNLPPTAVPTNVLVSPRFDLTDVLTPYQYARVELINRFRRKSGSTIERFFLLQLSEQYNFHHFDNDPRFGSDPRFQHLHGPLELLSELKVGPFALQTQAQYQIDTTSVDATHSIHEYDWSTTLIYQRGVDHVSINSLFRNSADASVTDQVAIIEGYKTLPTFFDVGGNMEYSMRRGALLGYAIGFYFSSKPRSCWNVSLVTGRNSLLQPFASFNFSLAFGDAVTGRAL